MKKSVSPVRVEQYFEQIHPAVLVVDAYTHTQHLELLLKLLLDAVN